jgi:hypothetical protein
LEKCSSAAQADYQEFYDIEVIQVVEFITSTVEFTIQEEESEYM